MGGYFTSISQVFQILANLPRENTSKRVIVNLEVYLRGNLRGRSTSLLQYIYTSTRAREITVHGTAGTAHTSISRGRVSPPPYS